MPGVRFVIAALAAVSLAGCAAGTPAPTPVPSIRPAAGAILSGPIEMGAKAASAVIILRVSDDGSAITSIAGSFTSLKCDGFSAGSMASQDSSMHPITGRELRIDSSLGKLTGTFTSPTAVAGSIDLTINPGMGSSIPCGTWSWSASQK